MRSAPYDATTSASQVQQPSSGDLVEVPGASRSPAEAEADRPDAPFSSIDLLNLLRAYREAERKMRARTRESREINETDLLALRFLVRERAATRLPRQRDLAHALGLTAAATSVLVDRLSRDGYVQRIDHPEDRRSVAIEVIGDRGREIQDSLSSMQRRLISATEALTAEERAGAAKFLQALTESVSDAAADHD